MIRISRKVNRGHFIQSYLDYFTETAVRTVLVRKCQALSVYHRHLVYVTGI